jgi:glucokinase
MSSVLAQAAVNGAEKTYLVGDVGGTNCRLALASRIDGRFTLEAPQTFKCADFPNAQDAIDEYLGELGQTGPLAALVMAVAGPVQNGAVKSTNMHWALSERSLSERHVPHARLINDYTGLAFSVGHLGPHDLHTLGPDLEGEPDAAVAIVGAGTGFGASALTAHRGADLAGEGGHASFAPADDVEIEILRALHHRFGRVSIERLLSGPGLVNLYGALGEIAGSRVEDYGSEEIVHGAAAGDALCRQTLERFCAIYGSVAGDFALTYGARGGVYLAGGIAPAIADTLSRSVFRERFEAKGRFAGYMGSIPTRIIVHPYAALIGAAAVAAGLGASR